MTAPLAYIVDDDEAIRDALMWLFESRGVNSRNWASAEAFLENYDPVMQGCIVLDLRMEGMSGLDCFDRLTERGCRMPVIFLTGHGDVPLAVSMLRKGAYHFIEKPFNDNELVNVVLEALKHDAAARAVEASNESVAARLANLTAREREVMNLILAGKFNKVIADELNIAMRTVEVHRSRIFEKMGVRSAVELSQLVSKI